MTLPKRVGFFRFAFFYLFESAAYLAAAFVVGDIISKFETWGWELVSMVLCAYFAYSLAGAVNWTRKILARERAYYSGRDIADVSFGIGQAAVYLAAFLGAVCGWELALVTSSISILLIAAFYLMGFYAAEVWRVKRTF